MLHYGSLTELQSKSDCAASPFPALPPLLAALPYEAVSSMGEQNMLRATCSVSYSSLIMEIMSLKSSGIVQFPHSTHQTQKERYPLRMRGTPIRPIALLRIFGVVAKERGLERRHNRSSIGATRISSLKTPLPFPPNPPPSRSSFSISVAHRQRGSP